VPSAATTLLAAVGIALLPPGLAAAQLATTATTVVATPATSVWQQSVAISARVTPATATGAVQFQVDGFDHGAPAVLSGGVAVAVSVAGLTVGPHTVAATYLGDGSHGGSAGSTVLVVVQCATASDCPAGRSCAANLCVDPATLEGRSGSLDGCGSAGGAGGGPALAALLLVLRARRRAR
jgi:hypothetical protein